MAYYTHRERLITDDVPSYSIVNFPTLISESVNRASLKEIPPYSDMEEEEWENILVKDITYHDSNSFIGAFDINLPGTYLINWYISQMTGLSYSGIFLRLKIYNYELGVWENLDSGNRLLVSSSQQMAVINVSNNYFFPTEINPNPPGKVTLALFNESTSPLYMNRTSGLKAGIGIFGFNPITDEQLLDIVDKIDTLTENCCGMGSNAILYDCLKIQIEKLEMIDKDQSDLINQLIIDWKEFYKRFLKHNITSGYGDLKPTYFWSIPSRIPFGLNYRRVGYIYHFWLSGTTTQAITIPGNGVRLYITPVSDLSFLENYDRQYPATGTLFAISGSTVNVRIPVYIDNSGIYLQQGATGSTIAAGQYVTFSMYIILD